MNHSMGLHACPSRKLTLNGIGKDAFYFQPDGRQHELACIFKSRLLLLAQLQFPNERLYGLAYLFELKRKLANVIGKDEFLSAERLHELAYMFKSKLVPLAPAFLSEQSHELAYVFKSDAVMLARQRCPNLVTGNIWYGLAYLFRESSQHGRGYISFGTRRCEATHISMDMGLESVLTQMAPAWVHAE